MPYFLPLTIALVSPSGRHYAMYAASAPSYLMSVPNDPFFSPLPPLDGAIKPCSAISNAHYLLVKTKAMMLDYIRLYIFTRPK